MRPRILIADDDSLTVRLLAEILAHDYDIIAVNNHFGRIIGGDFYAGMEAAVVDLMLGVDVTGCEILAYLQEHHPHVRRIAMTAARDNGSVIECPAAQRFLYKPFSMEALRDCLAA